jgi:hypothetical protein
LAPFGPQRHALDVAQFREMLLRYEKAVQSSGRNPWTPETAPTVSLG